MRGNDQPNNTWQRSKDVTNVQGPTAPYIYHIWYKCPKRNRHLLKIILRTRYFQPQKLFSHVKHVGILENPGLYWTFFKGYPCLIYIYIYIYIYIWFISLDHTLYQEQNSK